MTAILRVNNLWKSYATGVRGCSARVWALRGCALTVRAGDRIAITGGSGAGKSSLLHCLAGLRTPDAGHIESTFVRITLASACPVGMSATNGASGATLFLVDDVAPSAEDAVHPLLLMSQEENAALIVTTRHLARVAPFVHQLYTLREGRLTSLPRSPVRRVAEAALRSSGTHESSVPGTAPA